MRIALTITDGQSIQYGKNSGRARGGLTGYYQESSPTIVQKTLKTPTQRGEPWGAAEEAVQQHPQRRYKISTGG